MSDLTITGLTKRFGSTTALDDVCLHARDGELLTLLGPSGCGKSTTLWSIAGLHQPDSGRIQVGDRIYVDGAVKVPPEKRDCGVVFQSYAIWPHMTVAQNVGYPLKLRRVALARRRARVQEVLDLVEMGEYADRYPHELSGGQQQRVALARALAHPPQLLLLDEPFSNLDAKLRDRAREWLRALQQEVGVTTVFVTHDQDEALSMSDRIAVMSEGRVHQVGSPEDIYYRPADRFVADFVGSANVLDGVVVESQPGSCAVRVGDATGPVLRVTEHAALGQEVTVVLRPEAVTLHDAGESERHDLVEGRLVSRTFLGDHYDYTVEVQGTVLRTHSPRRLAVDVVRLEIDPAAPRLLRGGSARSVAEEVENRELVN